MTVSGAASTPVANPSYGYQVDNGTYIPKSYEEILADRAGKTVWWKEISEAEAEKKKFMTIAELQTWQKENAPEQAHEIRSGGCTPLSEQDLERLAGRYRPDMSREELDLLLVELLDLGAITEQDRMIALGFRPVDGNFMNNPISTLPQYDTFDGLHNSDDLLAILRNYEEFLWRQAKALEYDRQDYSFVTDLRSSCQRLMDILSALSAKTSTVIF